MQPTITRERQDFVKTYAGKVVNAPTPADAQAFFKLALSVGYEVPTAFTHNTATKGCFSVGPIDFGCFESGEVIGSGSREFYLKEGKTILEFRASEPKVEAFEKAYVGKAVRCLTDKLRDEFLKLAESVGYPVRPAQYELDAPACYSIGPINFQSFSNGRVINSGTVGFYERNNVTIVTYHSPTTAKVGDTIMILPRAYYWGANIKAGDLLTVNKIEPQPLNPDGDRIYADKNPDSGDYGWSLHDCYVVVQKPKFKVGDIVMNANGTSKDTYLVTKVNLSEGPATYALSKREYYFVTETTSESLMKLVSEKRVVFSMERYFDSNREMLGFEYAVDSLKSAWAIESVGKTSDESGYGYHKDWTVEVETSTLKG